MWLAISNQIAPFPSARNRSCLRFAFQCTKKKRRTQSTKTSKIRPEIDFGGKNIRKAFFVSQISQIPLRAVWPDGSIIFEIFGHLQQWKFAQWHKPWSSLVEGCIGPIVKLFYDKPTKKYPAHACEHSIHVWLLGWSSCSPPCKNNFHKQVQNVAQILNEVAKVCKI